MLKNDPKSIFSVALSARAQRTSWGLIFGPLVSNFGQFGIPKREPKSSQKRVQIHAHKVCPKYVHFWVEGRQWLTPLSEEFTT